MPSPYNLLIQSTQVDTQNAIDRRSPLPGLADVHYGGPIPGYDSTAITTWDVVQKLWYSAYENAEADIFAYGTAYANLDSVARTAAANAIVADFQQSVDAFAAKYPNLGFRLFLQDGGENKFVSPDNVTIAATSDSANAQLGSSPQNRSVVTMAFNNTYNNTGLYQSAYYSTSTGGTSKGFALYMAGGVFRLNTSNGRQISPMFCLRLSINQIEPLVG